MKRSIMVLLLLVCAAVGMAQEPGTIKIRKKQLLKKAEYDETEYKVIAVDIYGNPKIESVASFELHFQVKGKLYKFSSPTNQLTPEMIKKMKELKKATKVWFTKIKGTESDGHLVDLPDFDYMVFPDCRNCRPTQK